MSDEIKYVDVDSEEFEDAPQSLREAYKKLAAKHKETTKSYADLRGEVATRAVADVLADKGFKNPERVKRDLLADGIDPLDNSAVGDWLTTNGDDYAKAAPGAEGAQEQQSAEPVPDDVQAAHQSLQIEGVPAGNDKLAAVKAKITPEMRGEDVARLYAEAGI